MKKKLLAALLVIVCALLLRGLVLQSYRTTTDSMEPTLAAGDRFLVNKFIFGRNIPFTDIRFFKLREPRRGDVVVFSYPGDPGKDVVMRVVGVPGDVVEGKDKEIFVNGQPCGDACVVHREKDTIPHEVNPRDNFGPVTVPDRSLFVMGDNRDRSYDSRFWGAVPYGRLKGLAVRTYWSWDGERKKVRWDRVGTKINRGSAVPLKN